MQKTKFNIYLLYVFIVYLLLAVYFCVLRGGGIPWVTFVQLLLALVMLGNYYVVANLRGAGKYILVFISSLIMCWVINSEFVSHSLSIFGPDPVDSLIYLQLGRTTSNMPFGQALNQIYNFDKLDDMGMPLIARMCYSIGGSTEGYYVVLMFLNSVAIAVSSYYAYKATRLLADYDTACIVSGLFASTGHFIMFATYGFKENFFILIIVLTVYGILTMSIRGIRKGLLFFLVFAPLICLFRLAVIAQIVIAIGAAFLLKNKKYRLVGIGTVVLVTGYVFMHYIDDIIMMLGGGNLEGWVAYAEAHNTGTSSTFQYLTQFVFSFMGPPPMFNIVEDMDFVHFVSFSACVRCFLFPFFVIGLIDVAKEFCFSKVFLLLYWVVGTFMLIVVLRGSDFRYSSMYYLPFLIFAIIGFNKRKDYAFSNYLCYGAYFLALYVTWGWNF